MAEKLSSFQLFFVAITFSIYLFLCGCNYLKHYLPILGKLCHVWKIIFFADKFCIFALNALHNQQQLRNCFKSYLCFLLIISFILIILFFRYVQLCASNQITGSLNKHFLLELINITKKVFPSIRKSVALGGKCDYLIRCLR